MTACLVLVTVPAADELGVTEIAQAVGLHVATAHNLLRTLSKYGYLENRGGRYRVDGSVSDREQFILISTECMGYRDGDTPSPELAKATLPDYFVVDYVRVFDKL